MCLPALQPPVNNHATPVLGRLLIGAQTLLGEAVVQLSTSNHEFSRIRITWATTANCSNGAGWQKSHVWARCAPKWLFVKFGATVRYRLASFRNSTNAKERPQFDANRTCRLHTRRAQHGNIHVNINSHTHTHTRTQQRTRDGFPHGSKSCQPPVSCPSVLLATVRAV